MNIFTKIDGLFIFAWNMFLYLFIDMNIIEDVDPTNEFSDSEFILESMFSDSDSNELVTKTKSKARKKTTKPAKAKPAKAKPAKAKHAKAKPAKAASKRNVLKKAAKSSVRKKATKPAKAKPAKAKPAKPKVLKKRISKREIKKLVSESEESDSNESNAGETTKSEMDVSEINSLISSIKSWTTERANVNKQAKAKYRKYINLLERAKTCSLDDKIRILCKLYPLVAKKFFSSRVEKKLMRPRKKHIWIKRKEKAENNSKFLRKFYRIIVENNMKNPTGHLSNDASIAPMNYIERLTGHYRKTKPRNQLTGYSKQKYTWKDEIRNNFEPIRITGEHSKKVSSEEVGKKVPVEQPVPKEVIESLPPVDMSSLENFKKSMKERDKVVRKNKPVEQEHFMEIVRKLNSSSKSCKEQIHTTED
jgi:hypothetical protein